MKNSAVTITIGIVAVALLVAGSIFYITNNKDENGNSSQSETTAQNDTKPTETVADNEKNAVETFGESEAIASQDEAQLLYLIEEEKLAHDMYSVLYDMYGERVFGNILKSEQTHQDRVLTLLNARGIADPRSSEIGVFTNPDLQELYDTLLVQAKISEQEAFRVGVTIEETDIADITKQLSTTQSTDIISVLEDLRRGSENHLRAFTRQL